MGGPVCGLAAALRVRVRLRRLSSSSVNYRLHLCGTLLSSICLGSVFCFPLKMQLASSNLACITRAYATRTGVLPMLADVLFSGLVAAGTFQIWTPRFGPALKKTCGALLVQCGLDG